jgi:hypothetical protein
MSSATGFCRSFIKTEASPPPEEMEKLQREYEEACTWIRDLQSDVPNSRTAKVDVRHIDSAPHINDPQLSLMVRKIRDDAARFNELINQQASMLEKSTRSLSE